MKHEILDHNQNYINRWIVSYADFVTMLLALFMVMYALSQLDITYMKTFSNSLGIAFNGNTKHSSIINTGSYDKSKLLKLFKTTTTSVYTDKNNLFLIDANSEEIKKRFFSFENQLDKESERFKSMKINLKKELGDSKDINIIREPRGLIIRINDAVLFDEGSDIIKNKALNILNKIASSIKNEPNSIKIENYTYSKQLKMGNFSSNWELSTARALGVAKYLVKVHQYSPFRISAVGYGEYMPDNQKTQLGRDEKRRVDIIILSSLSKIFEPESFNKTLNN